MVLGILQADGHIDSARTGALIRAARPLSVTFHRAFDMGRDPLSALDTLIDMGVDTLLTSGQAATAAAGIPLITKLVERAAGRIDIMPGSGINASNIRRIAEETGARTFHFSGKQVIDGPMEFRNPRLHMGDALSEYARVYTSAERIQTTILALR